MRPGRLSSLCVHRTQEKLSLQSKGIQANCLRAVEIVDLPRSDQPVLDSLQCRRGSASDHQGPAVQILFSDQVPVRKGVVPLRDQVDVALKEVVDMDAGDLPGLFLQGEQDIDLVAEKGA